MGEMQGALVAILTAGGGAALVAFGLFQWLGKQWLENRFASRLQDLQHEHGREIEHLRSRISVYLDRVTKLNQREFDVLPEAWSLIYDAYVAVERLAAKARRTHDFSRMNESHLEDVLQDSPLAEWQKEELKSLKPLDRTLFFVKSLYHYELHDAKVSAQNADFYLSKYGIFLSRPSEEPH